MQYNTGRDIDQCDAWKLSITTNLLITSSENTQGFSLTTKDLVSAVSKHERGTRDEPVSYNVYQEQEQ